ncbi:MAG TPA: GNAT family N-acetyltransferase [Candidatus Sulfotelmatobacter sp.]|nr:GNAT family N-acetyltransferase [Candidatus Sulfotelmatobacter sp.]
MRFYQIDPTQDARWTEFVRRHPKASVFHTVGWLKALRRTYGYEPVAFTTSSPNGELQNGLVFCRVKSWLTGRRLVSLPFSDHCEPLCDTVEDLNFLIRYLQSASEHQEWKYLEIRPIDVNLGQSGDGIDFLPAASHSLHTLDLRPELVEVFRSLDKDSVQRRIQRAQRADFVGQCGRSEDLLRDFYALFVVTRGRHRMPPSPFAWFRNLVQYLGAALEIRVAYKDETPVAAILTLRFRETVYYKYGCSDPRFNKFGAIPWLLWNAVAAAKSSGAIEFDMGRTEDGDEGLLTFKNHWVPRPKKLVYWRFPETPYSFDSAGGWKLKVAKRAFSFMPSRLLTISGQLLYRHIG